MTGKSVVTLETWDYVMMFATVALSTLVGFYHVLRVKEGSDTKQFLVSDKSLGFLPVVLSSVATAISAMSLQGYPLETYSYGIQFLLLSVSCFTSIYVFNCLFLPVYFNLGFSSIFQYLEYRFSRNLRIFASVFYSMQLILISSCMAYAPALALNQVTGLDLWTSVLSIGVVCMIYTALGGIKAVVWADVFQLLIVIVCVVVVAIKGFVDVGGMAEIYRSNLEGQRLDLNVYPNHRVKDTIWTYIIGAFFFNVCNITPNQLFIQRLISNPNLRKAKWSLCLIGTIWVLVLLVFGFTGLIMYTRYRGCDPYLSGIITSRDQMVPLFAVETLSFIKGLPGIFVAAVLCATLSTFSSVLNSLSALTLTDYIKPFWTDMTEIQSLLCSKILVIFYGVVCIALVVVAENMGGVVRAVFSITGVYGGTLSTVFALGVLFPWTNRVGAYCGFAISLVLGLWMAVGSLVFSPEFPTAPLETNGCNETVSPNSNPNVTVESVMEFIPTEIPYFYTLNPLWYPLITGVVGITTGLIASICTGVTDVEELDSRLVAPVVERFLRGLPPKPRIILGYKSVEMKVRRSDGVFESEAKTAKQLEEIRQIKEPLYPSSDKLIKSIDEKIQLTIDRT